MTLLNKIYTKWKTNRYSTHWLMVPMFIVGATEDENKNRICKWGVGRSISRTAKSNRPSVLLTWANKDKSHKEPDPSVWVASIITLAPARHRPSIHEFVRPAWFHQTGTTSKPSECLLCTPPLGIFLFFRPWDGHSSFSTPYTFVAMTLLFPRILFHYAIGVLKS